MYCLFSPIQHGAFLSSTYNHGEEKKELRKCWLPFCLFVNCDPSVFHSFCYLSHVVLLLAKSNKNFQEINMLMTEDKAPQTK